MPDVSGAAQRCGLPVAAYATPATTVPITDPVTRFQNIHVPPQPGVASTITVGGKSMRRPQIGPRRNQRSGQLVIPTRNPTTQRAL